MLALYFVFAIMSFWAYFFSPNEDFRGNQRTLLAGIILIIAGIYNML